MNMQKISAAAALALAGSSLLVVFVAHAQTTTIPYVAPTSTSIVPTMSVVPTDTTASTTAVLPLVVPPIITGPSALPPMTFDVDQYGNVLLRGTVVSASSSLITISSWGGTWTIETTGGTQVESSLPNSTGNIAGVNVGDFIGVTGIIASGQPWSVKATLVHDWTTVPGTPASIPTSASSGTTDTSGSGTASLPAGESLYTGTASNVSDSTFTLTDPSGAIYTVAVDSNTTLWVTARDPIAFSSIQSGDSVRVDGTLSSDGSSISAGVVRDTAR